MESNLQLFSPIVQGGFAGAFFLMFGFVIWLVKKLLNVISENSNVISTNTATIGNLLTQSRDELRLLRRVHDLLISRKCMVGEIDEVHVSEFQDRGNGRDDNDD